MFQIHSNSLSTSAKYSSNKHLLKSGKGQRGHGSTSLLTTEQGQMWIKEVASSSEIMEIPKRIDINLIYTPWSRWSKCRPKRGCKQVRRRRCAEPAICGTSIVKVKDTEIFEKKYLFTFL